MIWMKDKLQQIRTPQKISISFFSGPRKVAAACPVIQEAAKPNRDKGGFKLLKKKTFLLLLY